MKPANFLLTCIVVALPAVADDVVEQRTWTETWPVTAAVPTLEIGNVWGNVLVRPGPAGQITVTAAEERRAPDALRFERSLEVLRLDVAADGNGVSLHVGARDDCPGRDDECDGCRVDFQFDVRVPPGTIIDASTVMDGKVEIDGVDGPVSATNVNGPVEVTGIRDCRELASVNGDVTARFSSPPSQDCNFETINGDIVLDLPATAGLDLALDLLNGDVRSDLPAEPYSRPATVERVVDDGRSVYRLQKLGGLRVGAGGPAFRIESMNGDLRIRKH